jgi:outer membrane protein TolC
MKLLLPLLFLLFQFAVVMGQKSILDEYIEMGFQQNIVLQQKSISVEKALLTLQSAQSLYQPTIAIQGGYQSGEGGRSISFPVGDMLNPVYATLNQLTKSSAFPQIANVETNFFPRNFYDVKLTSVMPIYNRDISINKEIQSQTLGIQKTDILVYKRELVKNIKLAYLNYLMAFKAVEIYQNGLLLAQEGKKINEKLLSNGKGLPAYILRSENEIVQLTSQISEAEKQVESAKMYFNFLLNRELLTEIKTNYNEQEALAMLKKNQLADVDQREELSMLKQGISLQQSLVKMNESFYLPKLNGYLNVGSQSSNWDFNKKSTYYLLGMQLDIPIFAGKRNLNKIKQSAMDVDLAKKTLDLTSKQVNLALQIAQKNLAQTWVAFRASQKQIDVANTYQRLIEKGYREGVNTYIETLDARNQWTNAQLALNLNQFKILIAAAQVEREAASYPIKNDSYE